MAARCNSFPFSCRTCRAGARSGPLSLLLSLRLIISFPLFPTGLHPDTLKLSSRRWNRVVSALVSEETAIGSRFSGTDAFKLTYLETFPLEAIDNPSKLIAFAKEIKY
ncbi:hypothetical protein SLEP1_g41992 [Rubroshorea leprosula]|uniref:Uncharacterized protein n=1 Tax=Rubroshorea leprosula TaxID=152421 RepID=A0AAV5L8A6_9ROSI|nr:hypothetical protein SLEP1_g41992 [Rubroshorea leprosula]